MRTFVLVLVLGWAGCESDDGTRHPSNVPEPDGATAGADLAAPDPGDLAAADRAAGLDLGAPDQAVPDSAAAPDLGVPDQAVPSGADLERPGGAPDLATHAAADLAAPVDLAHAVLDGGSYVPPSGSDDPVAHAPPTPLAVATRLGGQDVLDASVDQGGGLWAVTTDTVYYFPPGRSSAFTYSQASGLARGWYSWTDTWFDPGVRPVTFASVAGGAAGEAVIGNIGAIADRLQVNSSTGAVLRIDNMKVTTANTNAAEYPEHLKRVVAALRVAVDLNGTLDGTAYLGGFHGFYAFHGLLADCGCLAFEEHQHYMDEVTIGGADVRALAFSPDGDVWAGDRDFVQLLPQRSRGANVGLFDFDFATGRDVFPGVRDEVWGLGVDGSGGVFVASYGNGLAYLRPATYVPTYWSRATALPQDHLTDVTVDTHGDVWVATASGGLARLQPSSGTWTYHTTASGLPSNGINRLSVDRYTGAGTIYAATHNGIAVITP
jgi:hypothetical protein